MSVSTPIPSSVTCFKNGLSHLTFPINFRPGLSPVKIGPLTATTVNGSISVIPDDDNTLKIYSITSENNLMIKVHYKLENSTNQDQDGKANFSYICPGINWKPNYLVKVNNDNKILTIGGRATIVSTIQFMDDIILPQLSLVSGVPNIACAGECDPLVVSNAGMRQHKRAPAPQQQVQMFGAARNQAFAQQEAMYMEDADDFNEDFEEEKVGELYHFKLRNVPINFEKATSVPFMDDILDIPISNKYTIALNNSKANNQEVPAKHHFEFLMKYAPPLPKGPVMIYLQNENGLNFSCQTHLKIHEGMFRLDTTTSNDVYARYFVTSGEKSVDSSIKPHDNKDRVLYATNKIAKIVVKNRKKEEVDVHLEVIIHGTACINDESVKIIEKPNNNDLNPENVITCDMKVSNETKEIEFTYVVKNWEVQTIAHEHRGQKGLFSK